MEGYTLHHKQTEATLGGAPIEFMTKNNDVAYLIVQKHLNVQMKELEKLIEEIKELVDQQFRDEDLAIFGRSPYEVSKEICHLAIDTKRWAKMSVGHRQTAIGKF
eukprot:gene14803-16340_t